MSLMEFNIVDLGDYKFRCVLGERYYFDFTIDQYSLFAVTDFVSYMQRKTRTRIYDIFTQKEVGDLASVRMSKLANKIFVLARIRERGMLFVRNLM